MKADKKGQDSTKDSEGCKLHPYLCSASVPTIGYGNTFYPNGKKVTMKDKPITQAYADELFLFILDHFERDVSSLIKVSVTQNQFNAILDFAYNVGTDIDADDIPEGLGDSTLLKLVNRNPNDPRIADEFRKWNKSKGISNRGLTDRREREVQMYYSK